MILPKPYWSDGQITLYHGDAREIMPLLPMSIDAIIADPPYGETALAWDRWPEDWPHIAAALSMQLWCFGSMRMFMEKTAQFDCWKFAQDIVWEKHNGSNSFADRFRRVHEGVAHFYRGEWSAVHKEPQFTSDAVRRTVRRSKNRTQHWGDIGEHAFTSEDGGPRLTASVLYVRSCHGHAVHPTQKPEGIVSPLVLYSVPHGGLVLDPFAGSGTTLAVARKTGRRAIGIELLRDCCDLAVDRLSQQELLRT
jgi:site-specific DNA-methyltransferase (adenine-specific)